MDKNGLEGVRFAATRSRPSGQAAARLVASRFDPAQRRLIPDRRPSSYDRTGIKLIINHERR